MRSDTDTKYKIDSITAKNKPKKYDRANSEKLVVSTLAMIFLCVYYIMPQYTGINIGFDLTPQRMVVVLLVLFIIEKRERVDSFFKGVKSVAGIGWLITFMFVLAYTAVLRRHIGTFLYSFFEFVGLFIIVYIVSDAFGIKKTIKILNFLGLVLCILGVIEYAMKTSLFSYMVTLPGMYTGKFFRSGHYRIMGPANHSLAYGLMLVTMIPYSCLRLDDDQIDIFAHPIYFSLIALNIILTGSRSTLAVFGIELLFLFIVSSRYYKKKALMVGIVVVVAIAALVVLTWGSSLSNYIMLQLTSVIDELFDTNYSEMFGAETQRLTDSTNYRNALPKIFTCPWLNPVLGRGSQASFSWLVDGIAIKSVDNFYISMYIKYAYPGMISYCLFLIWNVGTMMKKIIINKSGFLLASLAAVVFYLVNVWWLDALMTLKYMYIPLGLFIAYCAEENDRGDNDECSKKRKYIR